MYPPQKRPDSILKSWSFFIYQEIVVEVWCWFFGAINMYPFNELVVVLFDLNADRHLREFLEHILQQSKLPVVASAVTA